MNTRIGIHRARIVRASAGAALVGALALSVSACATVATDPEAPGSGGATAGRFAVVSHLATADALERAIRQEVEQRQALAESLAGLPADRIQQRVDAQTASVGRTARSVKECAALALAQRPLVTADTAERLVGGSCA
ncbi:hypothetical protein ARHIZOSPH14_27970 [Agromyces rhizosphaerae]|uniref:Uncharacterized protein n=1 Tax=Agromyces rhizosphaerae TaxID=88374 RepID=A0A9W6CYB3_9MICO|nr:hypothetical protein [Agromyces rhizosphaerae]GLI28555.1 hypothetical protein ARHIZOSPH14_27970 [Agromyces rhizosphaerae]